MSDIVKRLRFYRHGDAADLIEALEAALAKADELAEQCDDAFYHTDAVGLPEFYQALDAYREARKKLQ